MVGSMLAKFLKFALVSYRKVEEADADIEVLEDANECKSGKQVRRIESRRRRAGSLVAIPLAATYHESRIVNVLHRLRALRQARPGRGRGPSRLDACEELLKRFALSEYRWEPNGVGAPLTHDATRWVAEHRYVDYFFLESKLRLQGRKGPDCAQDLAMWKVIPVPDRYRAVAVGEPRDDAVGKALHAVQRGDAPLLRKELIKRQPPAPAHVHSSYGGLFAYVRTRRVESPPPLVGESRLFVQHRLTLISPEGE